MYCVSEKGFCMCQCHFSPSINFPARFFFNFGDLSLPDVRPLFWSLPGHPSPLPNLYALGCHHPAGPAPENHPAPTSFPVTHSLRKILWWWLAPMLMFTRKKAWIKVHKHPDLSCLFFLLPISKFIFWVWSWGCVFVTWLTYVHPWEMALRFLHLHSPRTSLWVGGHWVWKRRRRSEHLSPNPCTHPALPPVSYNCFYRCLTPSLWGQGPSG